MFGPSQYIACGFANLVPEVLEERRRLAGNVNVVPEGNEADLDGQVAMGNVRITTSIQGRLLLHDRRQAQPS